MEEAPSFDDLWLLWPRGCHVKKRDAFKAWAQLTEPQQLEAIVGLVTWLPVWDYRARQRQDFYDFLPHCATWIRGWRWEDELPPEFNRRQEVRVETVDAGPKTTMPDHVKALIAKMRQR